MLVALIDFETTGIDTKSCRPIEMACALFDTDTNKILARVDELIYSPDYAPLEQIIIDVTSITDTMLQVQGVNFNNVMLSMLSMFSTFGWPKYFVAHNAAFDKAVLRAEMKRNKEALTAILSLPVLERLFDLGWVCSINDISHPERFKCRKLSHLALDYGIQVDPSQLHRAFGDLTLMAQMFEKISVDWAYVEERLLMPWIIVRAVVPHPKEDNGAGKDRASASGFRWQNIEEKKFPLMWVKKIKEPDFSKEQEKLGYPLSIVEK